MWCNYFKYLAFSCPIWVSVEQYKKLVFVEIIWEQIAKKSSLYVLSTVYGSLFSETPWPMKEYIADNSAERWARD